MPTIARDLFARLRADAGAAERALLDLANPPLVPAFAGELAPCPDVAEPGPGAQSVPAPEHAPDQAAILAEILALTEELDRQTRRTTLPAEVRRPRGPLAALGDFGRRWLLG